MPKVSPGISRSNTLVCAPSATVMRSATDVWMRRGGDGACRLVGLMNGPSISASANTRIAT